MESSARSQTSGGNIVRPSANAPVDALAAKRAGGERLDAAPAMPMQITRRIIAERGNGRRSRRSPRG